MIWVSLKMLAREDFTPQRERRAFFAAAPCVSLGFALFCLCALPFGGTVEVAGRIVSLQPMESPVGLVFVLAMLSLGVHGVAMAGYASGSNYGLIGGLRGAAQMMSYEVCLAATLASVAFLYGTLDLQEAVLWQGRLLGGWLPAWGLFLQPLGLILFLTAGAALTKRTPFDLPEGEAEIVGYHVESIVIAGLVATLFLGGWQIPFLTLRGLWGGVLMLASFTLKVLLALFLLMQVRWSLPRPRLDQLLDLGWKNILPLALANLLVTVWGVALWR